MRSNFFPDYNVGQDISDIRAEPQNVPLLIMQLSREIGLSIPKIAINGKFGTFHLLSLKFQLRFLHAHTRIRGDYEYNKDYNKIKARLDAFESDNDFWRKEDFKSFLNYFNLLMDWYDLESRMFERFNLAPAEDDDLTFPDVPVDELNITPLKVLSGMLND